MGSIWSFNGNITLSLIDFNQAAPLLILFGLLLTAFLVIKNIKGAILIGIITTTILGIQLGVTQVSALSDNSLTELFHELGTTFGAAFFASVFMALCYSISYGIAAGFIFYLAVKLAKRKFSEIQPRLVVCTLLFILNFIVLAVIEQDLL